MTHHRPTPPSMTMIAQAIEKDPHSWTLWSLLVFTPESNDGAAEFNLDSQDVKERLQSDCHHLPGTPFLSSDALLILTSDMSRDSIDELAASLCSSTENGMDIPLNFNLFSIQDEWKTVAEICGDHQDAVPLFTTGDTKELNISTRDISLPAIDKNQFKAIFEDSLRRRQFRQPARVLLVEDDPLTRRIASTVLKDRFRLITAQGAEDALIQYWLHAPDIVFLDINLPDGNGIDILRAIRADDTDAFIVMFSGNGYLENLVDSMQCGAEGFVTKPFRREQLDHYIHACMDRSSQAINV